MAYDARKREVLEELEKTDHSPEAKEAIRKTLDGWFSQREGRLVGLVDLLEPRDGDCHRDWLDDAKEAAAAAHDALGRGEHGKLWLAKIANEEHTFFYEFIVSQIPVKRDLLGVQTRALAKAEREFEEKWKTIRESDKAVEERMQKIALEYDGILKGAASVAATVEKESKEKAADTFRKVLTLGLAGVDLGAIEYALKGAASALGIKISEVEARKLEIHALLSREEGIFATFKEARGMVQEFLKETSYPHVKDAFEKGEDAAEALPGRMPTPGQKADAEAFGSAAKNKLDKAFRIAEDAYKAFARKHEYLFFGPLGGSYYQELMEGDFWKERSSRWKDSLRDIDDLLRERHFEAREDRILDVSLEGIKSDEGKIIYDRLQAHCRELLRVWNKFKETVKNDPEWALESRETLQSVLDPFR